MRVVSLLPGATEMACALGLGNTLVGRSHECDFPSFVSRLPICTKALVDSSQKSADINLAVHKQLQQGLSLYEVDWQTLRQCRPDVILTQSQCRVCAVDLKQLQAMVNGELGSDVKVIDFHPTKLADVWKDILSLGEILDVADVAEKKCAQLSGRVEGIFKKTKNESTRPTVAMVEWIDPLMAAGHWTPELVDLAGGRNLFGEGGRPSDWLSYEHLRAADPDMIVVAACGFGIDRARDEMTPLTTRDGWYDLSAVQNNRVYLCDGNQYFNRPGPRLVDSLEILAEITHPDIFDFGHKHENWQYWGFDRVD
jgi:iron complex transport system substrate-binding protein